MATDAHGWTRIGGRKKLLHVARIQKSMLPVVLEWPWKLTAYPPITRNSTWCEFNNFKNSLKSGGSRVVAINNLTKRLKRLQALLPGCQVWRAHRRDLPRGPPKTPSGP